MSRFAVVQFFTGISSAIAMKLTSSIDDVLWLSTFLTPTHSPREKLLNMIMYASVCLLQTTLAYILSSFGSSILDNMFGGTDDERMSTDRLLTLISGVALFLYAILLGIEYYKELTSGDEYVPVMNRIQKKNQNDGTDQSFDSTLSENSDNNDCTDTTMELGPYTSTFTQVSSQQQQQGSEQRRGDCSPKAFAIRNRRPSQDDLDDLEQQRGDDNDDDNKNIDRDGYDSTMRAKVVGVVVPLDMQHKGNGVDCCPSSEDEEEGQGVVMDQGRTAKKSRSLFIIAFLGSLDDLTLFVPMLVGKALTILELVIGAMMATMLIVLLCLFLTKCKRVASILEQIPLVAIVSVFSIILLVKGIFIMN